MRRWFDRLHVHRKLVAMALAVSAAALLLAASGLMLFDLWRYRTGAEDDATALARIIAENTSAAVLFADEAAAGQTLSAVRVRPVVTRACIYLEDGGLFATYERDDGSPCPASAPTAPGAFRVGASAPILSNSRRVGTVYVERDASDLGARFALTGAATLAMLVIAGALAFLLAQRVTRTVSRPIAELARTATRVGEDLQFAAPAIETSQDEVGDLVRAFHGMLARVREANDTLLREIEERKKIESERETLLVREREANRLKDEFLAAVSHELRTPLTAIVGWIQVLETTSPSEETRARAIASIARNARAQTRLIEDLVDVSRIVTGKLHLRLEPVDLRAAIDAAVEVVRPLVTAKQIRLAVTAPPAPCLVSGDRDRLQQIAGNLLSNAVKFTNAHGSITVTTRGLDSAYEVAVHNTGSGIAPGFLPYVFDRFRQADGSITRGHGGLGLGLAIVKELVELHGGTVGVASAGVGQGATFTVRLPALIGAGALEPYRPDADAFDSQTLAGVRVLVVDDNADALDVTSAALATHGAVVRTAASGAMALDVWAREPVDVLLCDLAMPEMDGFDLLRRIREREAVAGGLTPAIAVSAHATRAHRQRGQEAGFVEYLTKPYQTSDLVKAVKAALAHYI